MINRLRKNLIEVLECNCDKCTNEREKKNNITFDIKVKREGIALGCVIKADGDGGALEFVTASKALIGMAIDKYGQAEIDEAICKLALVDILKNQ